MNLNRKHAIGLLAALLVLGIFSVALVVHSDHPLSALTWALGTLGVIAGVTVTYEAPVAGATPPTAAQVAQLAIVSATVNMADGDTTATVTHNFGNPGYGPTDTSQGYPVPIAYYTAAGTGPVVLVWVVNSTTAVLTKASSAGSGGTFQVVVLRPHTRMR